MFIMWYVLLSPAALNRLPSVRPHSPHFTIENLLSIILMKLERCSEFYNDLTDFSS